MADNGSGCHGSQFFITTGENLEYLNGKHTVFGEVAEGMDVLTAINEAYCDKDGRPYQDIRIYHTLILEDPFEDLEGLVVPERSPSPPPEVVKSDRIGAAEDIDEFKGKTEEEIKEILASRESKANAQILEMVGDIPDADARPPENVLFVCKLNPATTDEDLEIIFSRFGPIVSCEVIRDQKTGDSLQYAFIEFENEEDCTKAYFKMDNVLIDDRRIHVDFSQSLAKVKGVNRRKLSEENRKEGGAHDGLVAKKKDTKGDNYEMVFDDSSEPLPNPRDASKSKEQKYKGREQRGDERDRSEEDAGRGHPGDRRGGGRDRDRGGREDRDRTSRHSRDEDSGRHHGHVRRSEDSQYHRSKDGDGSKRHGGGDSRGRERQREGRRSRSRSRSRGRKERR
eukprot:Em0016g169a